MAVPVSPVPRENQFDPIFHAAALRYDVPGSVLKAIAAVESSFEPDAYAAGEESRGLMQVRLVTARGLGWNGSPESMFDPATSIDLGARVLAQNFRHFRSWRDSVAAYNVGWAPDRVRGQTAAAYVSRVAAAAARWGARLPWEPPAPVPAAARTVLVPLLVLLAVTTTPPADRR